MVKPEVGRQIWNLEEVKFPFKSLYIKMIILNIFGEIKIVPQIWIWKM